MRVQKSWIGVFFLLKSHKGQLTPRSCVHIKNESSLLWSYSLSFFFFSFPWFSISLSTEYSEHWGCWVIHHEFTKLVLFRVFFPPLVSWIVSSVLITQRDRNGSGGSAADRLSSCLTALCPATVSAYIWNQVPALWSINAGSKVHRSWRRHARCGVFCLGKGGLAVMIQDQWHTTQEAMQISLTPKGGADWKSMWFKQLSSCCVSAFPGREVPTFSRTLLCCVQLKPKLGLEKSNKNTLSIERCSFCGFCVQHTASYKHGY